MRHCTTFYCPATDPRAIPEDASFVNPRYGLFGVADGVSAAFSPSHPPLMYTGGLTGGQVAARNFQIAGVDNSGIETAIRRANSMTLAAHMIHDLSPAAGDDVGGAYFSACQVDNGIITLILAGDCFALFGSEEGSRFITGIDDAAAKTEAEAIKDFNRALEEAGGHKGHAWDLYYPIFKARKVRCSNKEIGSGGYAVLNGDPALELSYTRLQVDAEGVKWIVLGTDGMLPSGFDAKRHSSDLAQIYMCKGLQGVLAWRDSFGEEASHIGHGNHPEASAVEILL